MLLLDGACELRLWQLLAEADAARTIHAVHVAHPDASAVPLPRLLEAGPHGVAKPLGRAAATFEEQMRTYEHETRVIGYD